MTKVDSLKGRAVLCIIQCAAMVELTAMAVWVSAMMEYYLLDAQQAGSLVGIYVAGTVVANLIFAPFFPRLKSGLPIAVAGTAIAGIVFFQLTQTQEYQKMVMLLLIGGLSIGPVLAVTEGTIGRSKNPHKLFAWSHFAVNLLAAAILASMPTLMRIYGGDFFYQTVTGIMVVGCLAALLGFPGTQRAQGVDTAQSAEKDRGKKKAPIPSFLWIALLGLSLMAANHGMILSFVERAGDAKNYGVALVSTVIASMAIAKLFPAALAALLEKYVRIKWVLFTTPFIQAFCAIAIFGLDSPVAYSVAAPTVVCALMFANLFAFGLIAKLDPSGRIVAMTPAAVAIGTGSSAFFGGTLVKYFGYEALAIAVCVLASLALTCFARLPFQRFQAAAQEGQERPEAA